MRYKSYYRLYDYRQHNIHSTKAMIDFYPILRTLWNRKLSNFKSLQIVMGKYFHTLSKSLFSTLTLNGGTRNWCEFLKVYSTLNSVWPDLANLRRFVKFLKVVGNFFTIYLQFCKALNLHWQIHYAFGQICIVCQILKNSLAIWSHWLWFKSS